MTRPNVLLLVFDDQRTDTISALGAARPATPTLDALVRSGTAFRHCGVTVPICTPGRAELLTGCTSFHNQVPWFELPIDPGCALLPQAFAAAGYHTVHVGKWHNDGHPRERGYAVTRRVSGQDLLRPWGRSQQELLFDENGVTVRGHSTELFVAAAQEEMARAPADRPWFMSVALTSPHDPFVCPEPFASRYAQDTPLPRNFAPEHPIDIGDLLIRDEQQLPWPRVPEAVRAYRARYFGMIAHHDDRLGALLAWMDQEGRRANTVVCVTGDHGLAVGDHGLLGKANMFQHSVQVPWILAGPGVPRGEVVDAPVRNVDVFPTLCALADVPVPASVRDGVALIERHRVRHDRCRETLLHAFVSPALPRHRQRLGIGAQDPRCQPWPPQGSERFGWDLLWHTQRALRVGRWKLHWYPLADRFRLYDLDADPDECDDLLTPWRLHGGWGHRPDPEAAALAERWSALHDTMRAVMAEYHDPLADVFATVSNPCLLSDSYSAESHSAETYP